MPERSTMEVFPNSRFVFRTNRFNWRDLIDRYIGKVRFYIQKLTLVKDHAAATARARRRH
jgi:hypothetical protein